MRFLKGIGVLILLLLVVKIIHGKPENPPQDLKSWQKISQKYQGWPSLVFSNMPGDGLVTTCIFDKKYGTGEKINLPSEAMPVALDIRFLVVGIPFGRCAFDCPPWAFYEEGSDHEKFALTWMFDASYQEASN